MPRKDGQHNQHRGDTKWYGAVVNREEMMRVIARHKKLRKDGKVDPRRVMEELMGWEPGTITDINQIDMKGTTHKSKNPEESIKVVDKRL